MADEGVYSLPSDGKGRGGVLSFVVHLILILGVRVVLGNLEGGTGFLANG